MINLPCPHPGMEAKALCLLGYCLAAELYPHPAMTESSYSTKLKGS